MSWSRVVANPFLTAYVGSAVLTWLIPLLIMGAARHRVAQQGNNQASQFTSSAMVLVYIWSVLLFTALVWFGHRQIQRQQVGVDLYRSSIGLGVFANLSLMIMVLVGGIPGGVFSNQLAGQGFYAQFEVMMLLTNLGYFLFATVFGILFFIRARRKEVIQIEVDESDYMIHDEKTSV